MDMWLQKAGLTVTWRYVYTCSHGLSGYLARKNLSTGYQVRTMPDKKDRSGMRGKVVLKGVLSILPILKQEPYS